MKKKLTILAVLVLTVAMSAYSVAGTYAKYTTSGTVTDSARVAKWGFTIGKVSEEQADLFKASYLNNADPAATTVASANGTDKVIAPGTSGSYAFKVVGTPEVAYTLAIAATVKVEAWDENAGEFVTTGDVVTNLTNNLKFTLTKEGKAAPIVENATAAQLQTALAGLYNGSTKNANVATNDTYTISWTWAYEVADDVATDAVNETDVQDGIDTALGNLTLAPKVTLTAKVTATQVD